MKKLIIFGISGFAEVAHFYFTKDSNYDVVAFTANKKFITKTELFGLPVIPFEDLEKNYPPEEYDMFIAIVYTNINKVREQIYNQAKSKGYDLVSYVNSKATFWGDLNIGENCFILENNVIQPFVKIGNDVIIWSGNHIGHHSVIEDHCFLASHVVISGNVTVGKYSFLGVNSTLRDGIKIGKECVIGAGAVILKNTKDKEVYTPIASKLLPISSDKLKHL